MYIRVHLAVTTGRLTEGTGKRDRRETIRPFIIPSAIFVSGAPEEVYDLLAVRDRIRGGSRIYQTGQG